MLKDNRKMERCAIIRRNIWSSSGRWFANFQPVSLVISQSKMANTAKTSKCKLCRIFVTWTKKLILISRLRVQIFDLINLHALLHRGFTQQLQGVMRIINVVTNEAYVICKSPHIHEALSTYKTDKMDIRPRQKKRIEWKKYKMEFLSLNQALELCK